MGSDGSAAVRQAERRLFEGLGVEPVERMVDLATIGTTVRVIEVGEGSPVLFVHGVMTAGASWASLAAELSDFRCLLLDRPGCGLSATTNPPPRTLDAQRRLADEMVADVFDGLGVASGGVISNSLGGWYALRSVAAHPDRVTGMVGMGFQGGSRIERVPLMMRFPSPSWLTPRRARVNRPMVRQMLKTAGMAGAIESGAFDERALDWMVALLGGTDTVGNEMRDAPRPANLRGPVAEVAHTPALLAQVTPPVHLFWGTDDIFGGEGPARELADALPSATVEMVPGAGHAPWFDAPDAAAAAVRAHLRA